MIYKERIRIILEDMLEQKRLFDEELKNLPDGFINTRKSNCKVYFTWQIPKGGRRRKTFRKGISKNDDLINKLLRKKYLKSAIRRIDNNIRLFEKTLCNYEEINEEAVLGTYLLKHPEMEGKLKHGRAHVDAWAEGYRKTVNFREDGLKSTSSSGSKMRSKGELIIASRLDFYKIPYRYEAPIEHPDVKRIPDFTIKRPRDQKIIYWEHLGMMDNEGYRRENNRKLQEYEDINVTPWNNLIMTYDQEDGGIDVRIIDGLIQGWLL